MARHKAMLLGFTIPDELAREVFSSDSLPAIQTHKFAWSLARAIRSGLGAVFLASFCPIQSYPHGRRLVFRGKKFSEDGFDGRLMGFINLIIFKHLSRLLACLFVLPLEIRRRKISVIFVHGVHTPLLLFAALSRIFGLTICAVMTDPPGVILPSDGRLSKLLKHADAWIVRRLIAQFDYVIALAPELADRFPAREANLIFPGIVERGLDIVGEGRSSFLKGAPFSIVYAGTLNADYGVGVLLDAIHLLPHENVVFKFYGLGDQLSRVIEAQKVDGRVEYGGFVGKQEIMDAMRGADLLINPRPTTKEFARMSFPSKLIEYLAMGRPAMTTRIPAIPSDYLPHFHLIDDESPSGMAQAIARVIEMDSVEREEKAKAGREFVISVATEDAVGRRIAELVRN